jgi:hypothetical protein
MVRKNKLKYQVLKQHDDDLAQKGKKKQPRLGSENKRRAAVKAGRFKEEDNDESFRRKIEGAFARLNSYSVSRLFLEPTLYAMSC